MPESSALKTTPSTVKEEWRLPFRGSTSSKPNPLVRPQANSSRILFSLSARPFRMHRSACSQEGLPARCSMLDRMSQAQNGGFVEVLAQNLQADWQTRFALPAGNTDSGDANKIGDNGVDVRQIHR